MSRFQNFTLRHISNGAVVQNGFDTHAIREGGTEVWAATTGENLSQLQVEIYDDVIKSTARRVEFESAVLPAADDVIHAVGTPGLLDGEVHHPKKLLWLRDHVHFATDMTNAQAVQYLWDMRKASYAVQEPK